MLRIALFCLLALPGLAWADEAVPSPDGEPPATDDEGDSDAAPADGEAPASPESTVPSPDGEPAPADPPAEPLPAAAGDVPPPEGAVDPFPAEPGDAPPPAVPATAEADAAETEGDEAVASSPLARPTTELYDEAQLRFAQLEFEVAASYFEEVLRREPEHVNARNFLVECLVAMDRQEDAVAMRDGAAPAGEATPVPGAEPEPTSPRSRNPRADRKFSAGLGLGGASVGLGAWAEFRPVWAVAISGGFGGLALVQDATASGIAGVSLGADFVPVPYYISPVVGLGLSAVFGDAVWRLDAAMKPLASGRDVRLLPHLNIGMRLDMRRFQLQAGLWLVPTGHRTLPLIPVPGVRVGLHF